jgi:hypothetical protein
LRRRLFTARGKKEGDEQGKRQREFHKPGMLRKTYLHPTLLPITKSFCRKFADDANILAKEFE